MKNSEKNSSKQVNSVNNEVLSPENIKLQLKAACKDMNAKETKEYIKSLAGYELRLTGQKPTQHYTVFYGEVRVCNVEQIQGIKADGTARGCVSVAKANLTDRITTIISKFATLTTELTADERKKYDELTMNAVRHIESMQTLLDTANERAAAAAAAAAKAQREEAKAAAKLKREAEKGKKAAEKLDNSTLLQVLIAKGIDEVEAKKLLNIA